MTAYTVQYLTTASTVVTVEADDPADAREKADEVFEGPNVCAYCAGFGQALGIELGDWEQDDSEHGVWS